MNKKWMLAPSDQNLNQVSQRWNVSPLIAQLLLNRGLSRESEPGSFLSPQLNNLDHPDTLPGAKQAAERIVQAIREGVKIILYGDYDVDGITGIAILWHMLKQAGASCSFYVPHRVEEGYGLNPEAIRRLIREGAGMIISIDCGITGVEAASIASEANVPLIITDHHTLPEELPSATEIVHPTMDPGGPNPNLCGAGVAFKLAWSIALALSNSDRVDGPFRAVLLDVLPLASLGTIADVVPLVGENRIIARHGLLGLPQTTIPGLRTLINSIGLEGKSVDGYDVGFKLAPRLNAAGRMGHARLAVELLTRADEDRSREIVLYLEEHNRSRQAAERKMTRQAVEMIEKQDLASDARRAIVLASDTWHPGVIGIVAARLVDRFQRPVILIALNDHEGQGSGRSIPHFNLSEALKACGDHLITHGGHAMAAGLRITQSRIEAFTEAFVTKANNQLTCQDLIKKIQLDAKITLEQLDLPTVESILGLGPFGVGNPRPKLASDWLELAQEPRCVGQSGTHLQATFRQNGTTIRAIGFGLGDRIELLKQHRRCRVAFEPIINDFRGRRSVEMQMIDLKFPE